MKKKYVLSLTLAAGILALSGCNNGEGANVVESDAGNITQADFYETLKDRYGEPTLKEMVYKTVLSKQYGITDEEVDTAVQEYKDRYGEQFDLVLMQLGLKNEEELREVLEFYLLQEKAALEKVEATDEELEQQYLYETKNVTARHILVEDEETANKVIERINGGEDFGEVAKEVSTDTGSAENGGDLGQLDPSTLVPEFSQAAFKLKEGEISQPVESQFGFHIIQATKVEDKEDVKSFEEMKPELEKNVKLSKLDAETIQEALDEAVEKEKIKINDDELKNIFKAEEEKAETNE
jgi:foldase protein PrsA